MTLRINDNYQNETEEIKANVKLVIMMLDYHAESDN
jgi:hypothetical protein